MSPFFANYNSHSADHFNNNFSNLEVTQPSVNVTALASVMSQIIDFLHPEMGRAQLIHEE